MSTWAPSISLSKNLSVTSSRASRDVSTISLRLLEGGATGEPTQGNMIGLSDNGQVWAIIGCVLTIVNILAALVFYLYKKRKKKLRKRVDDGRAIREAGSIPSDSHYTLPTNQDTHYHQIMDSSQGSAKTKDSIVMDDGGYITAITTQSEKTHGYTDILQFSEEGQRPNSYQEITDLEHPLPSSHTFLRGTCSLNEDVHVGELPNNLDNTTKRIQKKREKYLVNVNIPSDSNSVSPEDDARRSCVLSPELMDDGLFESLNDFAKYFTTLSMKRRNQNLADVEKERGNAKRAIIDGDRSDSKEDEITYHEIKGQTDNISSEDTQLQEKGFKENGDKSDENKVSIASIHKKTIETSECQIYSTSIKQKSSSLEKCQEIPSKIDQTQGLNKAKISDSEGTLLHDKQKSLIATSPNTTDIFKGKGGQTSDPNKEIENAKTDHERNEQAGTTKAEGNSVHNVELPRETANFAPLKKSVEMLESTGSSESNQSLNRYIRKHGILLPVKSHVGEVTDISCKRDTI